MPTVEVLVLSGAMPSSAAITLDVLATANRVRAAARRPAPFRVRVTGSGGGGARSRDDGTPADVVVVPGLGLTTADEVRERLARPDAVEAGAVLRAAVDRGAEVAASCSAVFLPAAAGLLDGRRATTTWWLAPLFRRLHPEVDLDADALVVRDGPVTTAGAAMAQVDLVLALLARHAGPGLARQCARYLLLDHRSSQSRYMALSFLAASDPSVAAAEEWARDRLRDCSVPDVADAVGLSTRTLARRVRRATGLSPVRFLQRLRVEAAVELLGSTRLSVEEVARRVGYAEPTTLRRALRRETGLSPRDLRGDRG